MTDTLTLTAEEKRVLAVLASADEDFGCYAFDPIMRATGLPIPKLRAAYRSLRDKRLVELHRGLMTEDGEMCGSGYGATRAGRELADKDPSMPKIEI